MGWVESVVGVVVGVGGVDSVVGVVVGGRGRECGRGW